MSNESNPDQIVVATSHPARPPEIRGVDIATAAFVDFFPDGPINKPSLIGDMADFERIFGGLDPRSEASYGISQFFANGGYQAWMVRASGSGPASADQLLAAVETLDQLMFEGFSLLCLPATANLSSDDAARVHAGVQAFASRKHALYLLDPPPSADSVGAVLEWVGGVLDAGGTHAATYFPRLTIPDPLNGNRPREVGPSGTIAGIYARFAGTREAWRAHVGYDAALHGAKPTTALTKLDSQLLVAGGVNAIRAREGTNPLLWGAHTLAPEGEWRYVPVRRLANYVEASLKMGLEWTVNESNDPALWAAIESSVRLFLSMEYMMRGAFWNCRMNEGYFVLCDRTTTSDADVENGVVNVVVGLAPLVPTEFVILRIQLRAGQNADGG